MGKIGGQEFSRLMLGGNLISGYSHARDLGYVAPLMRFYNTPAKIRETLETAEANGINVINTFVTDDISALDEHWKNGGKMKWIAQVGAGDASGCPHIQLAVDRGATGIHINGDQAETLLANGQFERVGEIVGHAVASINDLAKAEASKVIDQLTADLEELDADDTF